MAHNVVHSKKKFKCQLCDVWFKTSGNMKEHMKVHKGLVFKCSYCGKDFNKIGNLRLHEKRHTKSLKEYHCDLCPRIFSQKCLLKYHMRTHNGDRPFKCSACDSAFADKSNLRKHFRIHSVNALLLLNIAHCVAYLTIIFKIQGEKPFQCDLCDKTFNQKSSLTCHKRTHVTFKPHECQHCGKRFGLNEELIVHLRVHGENRKFRCSICDDEFVEHCYLKSHMRIHDLKTAGNKSVQVFKTADIDPDEPTCLVSVNGDENMLESIVLKKRQQHSKRKTPPKSLDVSSTKRSTTRTKRRPIKESTIDDDRKNSSIEETTVDGVTDSVSRCEFYEVSPLLDNDVKTEIKQELNGIEDTTASIPFISVSIKVEPGDLMFTEQGYEHDDSSNHSNFDAAAQSVTSDSEDEKPLVQRIDAKHSFKVRSSHCTRKPMEQFKHIIESAFPVVLVERLQYPVIMSAKVKSEEVVPSVPPNESIDTTEDNAKQIPATKDRSVLSSDERSSLYKCSYCPKELKTWASLIMHEQIHRDTFDCSTCHSKCSNILELIKHAKENPSCSRKNDSSFKCTICNNGISYRNKTSFDYHMTKHSGLRPFVCDVCSKTFRSKETLRQHMNRHDNSYNYNCEVCGRGFPNKNSLQQHQLSHTDSKPFKCDVCNNYFKSQGRLYNHKKIHMKPQFSCCYCSRQFTIVGNLKIHEMRHMKSELVDKFKCEICDKEFLLKHDLRYHMRKHNGERPYPCTLCPSRFADISNLHKHIKIHTGSKPYVCHCGKSYNQQSSLNTHKKTHLVATLVEKFLCTHCPKKFALEEDLTLHLRSHGIHSMFKCSFCDKEYELLNHLRSHRRIHLNLHMKRSKFLWPEKMNETINGSDSVEAMNVQLES
ncbi:hypothetical protein HA402_008331 [Bradysia odoriphaga]|nr:hypothetical protein HA402_008331 [Bradysia odoriphaga]